MRKIKIVLFGLLLASSQVYAAIGGNPFDRSVKNTVGTNVPWQYEKNAAVKVAQDSLDSDTYYHLAFDGKSLRLSLSSSAKLSQSSKHFDQFAVNDVKIDGQRLPLFQWCLSHQEKQGDYLQQGLAVQNGVCENRGENGTFIMKLNPATLNALKTGKTLSFVIKPFRTTVIVSYSLADFDAMASKVIAENAPPTPVNKPATSPGSSVTVAHVCNVKPPAGFEMIKPIEYTCDEVVEETEAQKSMSAKVKHIADQRHAEQERKHKAELAKKKKEEEALRKQQLKQKHEAAAELAQQQKMDQEITGRMVAMCKKMWALGVSRCYCEKYISQAPPGIKPNPACKSGK